MTSETERGSFGELVASRREAAGWTRRRLAAALGVSAVTVLNLEQGRRVSERTLRQVAGLAELGLQAEAEAEAAAAAAARAAAPARAPASSLNLRQAERDLVLKTLAASGGNKEAAAAALGVSRRTVYNLLERYAEDDAAAAAALGAGASAADVARALKTTPEAARAAARAAGVRQRRGRREKVSGSTRRALEKLRDGAARRDVAASLGCSTSNVDKLVKRLASEDAEALRVTLVGQTVEVCPRGQPPRAVGLCVSLQYDPKTRRAAAEVAGQEFSFVLPRTSPASGDVHQLGSWTFKVRRDGAARVFRRLLAEVSRRRELAAEARLEAARAAAAGWVEDFRPDLDAERHEAAAEVCEQVLQLLGC